jgi:hypothetical protein
MQKKRLTSLDPGTGSTVRVAWFPTWLGWPLYHAGKAAKIYYICLIFKVVLEDFLSFHNVIGKTIWLHTFAAKCRLTVHKIFRERKTRCQKLSPYLMAPNEQIAIAIDMITMVVATLNGPNLIHTTM